MDDAIKEVIIVGAGPVGLYLGHLLRDKGISFKILEEHSEIGVPNHCSGLISSNLNSFVRIDNSFINHEVKGAIFHSPSGKVFHVQKRGYAAHVIDREKFDKSLLKEVKDSVVFNSKVKEIEIIEKDEKVKIQTENGVLESMMVVGCDGANSIVRKHFGEKPSEILNGIICIQDKEDRSDYVEMWYDRKKTDGFFWKIPRGNRTEYGMAGTGARFKDLADFFKIKGKPVKLGGVIPMGNIKTYFNRAILLGDAGCQVKGWSGGGVIFGLTAARVAADVISRAVEKEDFSEGFLEQYQRDWKKEFGNDHAFGLIFRDMYKNITNEQIDCLFDRCKSVKGLNSIDMDFPSRFLLG